MERHAKSSPPLSCDGHQPTYILHVLSYCNVLRRNYGTELPVETNLFKFAAVVINVAYDYRGTDTRTCPTIQKTQSFKLE